MYHIYLSILGYFGWSCFFLVILLLLWYFCLCHYLNSLVRKVLFYYLNNILSLM